MSTEAPKKAPIGLGWKVRERRDSDGELLDCFLEAPRVEGMAYGLEVLGDDYTGYDGVQGKLKHCQMIAAWANAAPASAEPVAWVRRHPDGALTSAFLEHAVIDPVRKDSGAWVPLYTAPVAVRISTAWRESLEVLILNYGTACIDKDGGKIWGEIKNHLDKFTIPVADQPDVTQQTLDDVKAGIPARDAEIKALRKEIEALQATQAQQPGPPAGFISIDAYDRLHALCESQAERLLAIDDMQQLVSGADALPPFAVKVIEKLKRFEETCMDGQDSDIGKHWLDLLTQLGLLNRVQRSPAYWEITQQGEDVLSAALAQQDATLANIEAFVACDASAISYQSLGEYRTALLKMLHQAKPQTLETK